MKVPAPNFIVFYNGDRDTPDIVKLKLSDSFDSDYPVGEFEWTATMVNINIDHNERLHKKCKALYDYSTYIERVKQNKKRNIPAKNAIEEAITYAAKQNLLDGFFRNKRMEVLNMSLTEFDQEEYDRHRRAEGEHIAKIESAKNLLGNGVSPEIIAKSIGFTLEEVMAVKEENPTV